jgi:plasmid stabilization system protein ParE
LIELTAVAERHLHDLERHYVTKERYEALRNLRAALVAAGDKIERHPDAGLPAPAPYRHLARPGRFWLKMSRYWFTYTTKPQLAIVGIFYESANIPKRL